MFNFVSTVTLSIALGLTVGEYAEAATGHCGHGAAAAQTARAPAKPAQSAQARNTNRQSTRRYSYSPSGAARGNQAARSTPTGAYNFRADRKVLGL